MRMFTLVATLATVALTASCFSDEPEAAPAPNQTVTVTATPSQAVSPAEEPTPVATTRARIRLTSSCDNEWPLVIDPQGQSLVASARLRNTSDRGGKVLVTARWFPVGGPVVSATQTLNVPAGTQRRADFRSPVDMSVMGGMVGLQHGDEMCRITARLAAQ